MAIKSSGPLALENDIIDEFTHIDSFAPHNLTEYYGKEIIQSLSDNMSITYKPYNQIPYGQADEPLSFSNYYGVELEYTFLINYDIQEANLYDQAMIFGYNGISDINIIISNDKFIWSNDINTPALMINQFSGQNVGLNIAGVIMGKGGNGGYGRSDLNRSVNTGQNGGGAILIDCESNININVLDSGRIAGGGGGGGGMAKEMTGSELRIGGGGGGAGGGNGGGVYGNDNFNLAGGIGGAIRSAGGDGAAYRASIATGGNQFGNGGNWFNRKGADAASAGGGGGRVKPSLIQGTPGRAAHAGRGGDFGQPGQHGDGNNGGTAGYAIRVASGTYSVSQGGTRIYGPQI